MTKVVYLILAIVTGGDNYELLKIKYETFLTCDEIYINTVKFKEIGNRTYPIYLNKIAFAHWCEDEEGNYYYGKEYE